MTMPTHPTRYAAGRCLDRVDRRPPVVTMLEGSVPMHARILLVCALLPLAAGIGCTADGNEAKPTRFTQRLHAPPQGQHPYPAEAAGTLATQVLNGVVADPVVSDLHFFAGTASLNSLGRMRLAQVAEALSIEPGLTVYVDTTSRDTALQSTRLDTVEAALAELGFPDARATLGFGAARGLSGREAVENVLKGMRESEGGKALGPAGGFTVGGTN